MSAGRGRDRAQQSFERGQKRSERSHGPGSPKPVRVGLIGLGTVGTGVVRILQRHPAAIERRIGAPLRLAAICDQDLRRPRPGISLRGIPCTTDYRRLIADSELDLIIELIGGYEPARTIVLGAIERRKHVITANKALLAKCWGPIFTEARSRGVQVYFEASVGGGIPVIQALNEGLAANRIEKMMGILNGTTNYILTRMA
ncbi:MAG: homoserine dehydrogenase, partial [Elusimicrobia bacterium]|nr:homoserine dehydrogenase [Elusimicrobiota bacterium]